MLIIKLLFRNAFRHKLRSFLTILGITIAILAFGLLRTVLTVWYSGIDASSASRLVTRNAISLAHPMPLSYKEKIRMIDGVKAVSPGWWFGGIYKDRKNFFPNFAYEPVSFLEMCPEFLLTPDEKLAFIKDRKGCVVGRKTAARFGWKVGDTVTLDGTIFTGKWDFTIRGIYKGRDKNTDETQLFFQYDYLNERMKKTVRQRADLVGFFFISVKDPDSASEVAMAIDKLFKNSYAETLTESEKLFALHFISMMEAILVAIEIVSYIIIIIIMAVMANTMAMTTRERIGEYAVMKTMGFGGRHIAAIIFGESFVISALGCILGIALTFPAASAFSRTVGSSFPDFIIQPKTIYLDIGAALIIAFIAALFPTWQAINIRIADGLRRIQ
ncbi:MAG: ABC transporter ATP-binding protein [Chloroflexi bacterium HGW-Chloroflexi-5]|jgi:putative ABC transport system permease protein|nr:MAG: ABC transporter ATP-binding protein [Deltaproteobacteria bacterium HGW-Deltaproteobacteria-12]PKN96698.1 MAG: ABC transporter ATP-binding protein [Chloroflexi bacterium HGW-Chloroflexi-5]